MNVGKTLFAQIMEFVPWTSFSRIVARYGGDSGVRRLTCSEQFRVMAFAQLTWRESLRDIEVTLGANSSKPWKLHRNGEKSFKSAPNKIGLLATPILAFTTN